MRRSAPESGFALLAALWLVVFVVGITATALVPLRTRRLQVRNFVTASITRQEARSGIVHAVSVLHASFAADVDQRGVRGASVRLQHAEDELRRLGRVAGPGGGAYELRIEDESGRYPLNTASEAELQRLFAALGLGHLEAVRLAAAIADWMDPDELHRLNGAEWDDYYSDVPGGRHPANGPFVTLDELREVRGVDAALYDRLRRLLTVARDVRVNLNTAPEPVIAALPGIDRVAARRITQARRAGATLESLEDVTALLDTPSRERLQASYRELRRRASFVPATYRIVSTATPPGPGHPVTMEAVIAVNGARISVLRILERRPS